MGCSASRSGHDFIHPQKPPNSGSPHSDSRSTPVSRSLSLPSRLVHHPPVRKGDSNHLVVLTSSTYGSLVLIDHPLIPNPNPNFSSQFGTQIETNPLSPGSVVNTWELMEGLDDDFGFHVVESPKMPNFESTENEKGMDLNQVLKSYEFVEHLDSVLQCKNSSEQSLPAKMDRSPLSTLLPDCAFQLKGTEDRIVLYYTSLRGIRKTYEECCDVRMIFRGFQVCVDERDISMDSSYRKELQGVLGDGKDMTLPQVFIRGRHIGGVNEIRQLHEAGELPELLKGFPVKQDGLVCTSCGDARFMLCPSCSGSRKVFKSEERRLRRCADCNENGLIRCPFCLP